MLSSLWGPYVKERLTKSTGLGFYFRFHTVLQNTLISKARIPNIKANGLHVLLLTLEGEGFTLQV